MERLSLLQNCIMGICLLCKIANATKRNSHIIPFFLIKEAINKEGEKLRDYEIAFSIYDTFVSSYFGRNIQPEKIEEIEGHVILPEEISRINPFSLDYIFCPQCEDKFGKLEGLFEREIYSKLNTSQEDIILDSEKSKLLSIFAYSIYWRASAVNFNGFKLNLKAEKKLQYILDTTLNINDKVLRTKIAETEIENLPYCVITSFFITNEDSRKSTNVIKLTTSKIPYFFVLNKICFQLFEKNNHVYSSYEYRYGLNRMFDIKKNYEFYKKGQSIVAFISNANRKEFVERIFEDVVVETISSVTRIFSQGFKHIFGASPNTVIKDRLLFLLNKNAKSKFMVFSQQNVLASCVELMIEVAKYNGIVIEE